VFGEGIPLGIAKPSTRLPPPPIDEFTLRAVAVKMKSLFISVPDYSIPAQDCDRLLKLLEDSESAVERNSSTTRSAGESRPSTRQQGCFAEVTVRPAKQAIVGEEIPKNVGLTDPPWPLNAAQLDAADREAVEVDALLAEMLSGTVSQSSTSDARQP
jgi:hypothetical protein